jgi:hypothetical protein
MFRNLKPHQPWSGRSTTCPDRSLGRVPGLVLLLAATALAQPNKNIGPPHTPGQQTGPEGGAPAPTVPGILLDRIAVTVGKDVITEGEIDEEIRMTAFLNNQTPDFSEAAKRAAAERLVDQHLIRGDMQLSNWPQPESSESARLVAEYKREHFRGDEANYRAALKRYGISETELQQHLLWQLAALRYTDFRFQPDIPPPSEPLRQQLGEKTRERSASNAQQAHSTSPAPPLQLGHTPTPPPRTDQSGAPPEKPTPQNPVPQSVDEQMDAWLKQTRARARIVYHQEAFKP